MLLALAGLILAGICVGSTGWQSAFTVFQALLSSNSDGSDSNITGYLSVLQQVVWEIRLPRSLGAALAGGLLGLAGALAQGLFRNPLADPYLLGSASGAALGVALALLALGSASLAVPYVHRLGMTGAGFAGAVLAVSLTTLLARGAGNTLRLLLAGVVVGVVLGAGSSLVTVFSPELLQAMQSFMLGSTAFVGWQACGIMAAVLGLCLLLSAGWASVLDALGLGEQAARSLGFNVAAMRMGLIVVLSLATGTAVAQTGLIAFVGLAAPHAVRALGPLRHRALLGLSALMGAVLLTAADVLARSLIAPQELALGIVTALLGGAYLLWLMGRQRFDGQHAEAA
jgi:iron complex transport system permease protein